MEAKQKNWKRNDAKKKGLKRKHVEFYFYFFTKRSKTKRKEKKKEAKWVHPTLDQQWVINISKSCSGLLLNHSSLTPTPPCIFLTTSP